MSDRKLATPSLATLSFILRNKELWPETFCGWYYGTCSTCAMGLANALWPEKVKDPTSVSVAKAFGISGYSAQEMFCFSPGHSDYITPEMVADKIDSFLERMTA